MGKSGKVGFFLCCSIVVIQLVSFLALAEGFDFFSKTPDIPNINATNVTNATDPNSKLYLLIQEIQMMPPDQNFLDLTDPSSVPQVDVNDANNQTQKIPDVEFDKLKTASQHAGLPDTKADRVARACKMLNMNFDEAAEVRKVMMSPTTSAAYADKVRRRLEEAVIEQETKDSQNDLWKTKPNIPAPGAINSTPLPIVTIEKGDANAGKQASMVDPLTMHRLNVSSTLAGLNKTETHRLMRAISDSTLNATQVSALQKVITEHGPTAEDLSTLADHLEQNSTAAKALEDNSKQGIDWLYLPIHPPNKTARAIAPDGDFLLFSAKRYCGFSPKVRLPPPTFGPGVSRASPGQFPWSVAVLASDDSFLCAGSLISESIVLTTASCIINYRKNNLPIKLVLGAYSLPADLNNDVFPQLELFAKSAVVHPGYNADSSTPDMSHNIGLLRLSSNVDFDFYPWIFPICLIGPALEQYAGTNQCKAIGWPDLPEADLRRVKSLVVASIDVQVSKTGCPSSASTCMTGAVCNANEGSEVICLANSQRYYQWGIVGTEPHCDRSSTTTLPTVSVIDNYDFIAKYLWTSNPNTSSSQS